jgi:hypothetical protein
MTFYYNLINSQFQKEQPMSTDKKVYIEFQIEICNSRYSYDGTAAQEQLNIELPSLEFFSQLDVGNLFKALSLNLETKFKQKLEDRKQGKE